MDPELDRILTDDYLDGLSDRPVAELRRLRSECQAVETQLSYLRRLIQGRHDIVAGELGRRRQGGDRYDVADLVDHLPQILADRIHAPGPGRLPASMEPGELSGRFVDRLNEIRTLHRGPNDVLLALSIDFRNDLTVGNVEDTIYRLELAIKKQFPVVKRLFVEMRVRVNQHETPASG